MWRCIVNIFIFHNILKIKLPQYSPNILFIYFIFLHFEASAGKSEGFDRKSLNFLAGAVMEVVPPWLKALWHLYPVKYLLVQTQSFGSFSTSYQSW